MIAGRYLVWVEAFGMVVIATVALWFPHTGNRWFRKIEGIFRRLGRHRAAAMALCAATPVVIRLCLLPVLPVPDPGIQEEFSYLLSGDTIAAGRLANPPHPMAAHLETFQVLQWPTYASIRPPGQGIFLAVGERFLGTPWAGVVISVAAMCAALCWMLQVWLPPGWALLGGLLIGIRIGVFSNWMNSYWGGAVAALGGMLVLGATARICRNPRIWHSVWLALGIFFLVTTRTYEGILLLIPVGVTFAAWMLARNGTPLSTKIVRFGVPVALLLLVIAGWLAYYNWRVTHSPWVHPYSLGRAQYSIVPPFFGQRLTPMHPYRYAIMRRFYVDWEIDRFYYSIHSLYGYIREICWRAFNFWKFYVRPPFTLPLLLIPWLLRDRRLWILWGMFATAICGSLITRFGPPYYYAPFAGPLVLVTLEGMRRLRVWQFQGRRSGLALVRGIPVVCAAIFVVIATLDLARVRILPESVWGWSACESVIPYRAIVKHRLESMNGLQLAIVRYPVNYSPHLDWVFNRADVDRAKIVWARDMGAQNEELLRYFHNRRAWLIEPGLGTHAPSVRAYSAVEEETARGECKSPTTPCPSGNQPSGPEACCPGATDGLRRAAVP